MKEAYTINLKKNWNSVRIYISIIVLSLFFITSTVNAQWICSIQISDISRKT